MPRRLYWCLAITLYGILIYYVLREVSPVMIDGSGPLPSFRWTNLPTPDLREYYARRSYYDFQYFVPYAVAALIITILGCVGPLICRRAGLMPQHPIVGAMVVTFILLVLVAAASDLGGMVGLWYGPRTLLRRSFDMFDVPVLAKIFVLPSLLSGAVLLGNRAFSNSRSKPV